MLISARFRATSPLTKLDFVHVGGYLIDQNGTRYAPGFAPINSLALPVLDEISPRDLHELRTGEIYRYSLGPAKFAADPDSPKNAIQTITVYLDGQAPKTIPLVPWNGFNDPKTSE